MENEISIFNFEGRDVRTVEVNGKIHFAAKDVVEAVGNVWKRSDSIESIFDEWKIKYNETTKHMITPEKVAHMNNYDYMWYLSEEGIYQFIGRAHTSKNPKIEKFQKWLYGEVLPTIRKTGKFEISQPNVPKTFAQALRLAAEQQEEIERQQALLEKQKPLVEFAEQVSSSSDCVSVGIYAKMIFEREGIEIGERKLFDFLRDKGYLMSGRDKKERNLPYQKWIEKGYFKIEPVITAIGVISQTVITGAGQVALLKPILDFFRGSYE